MARHVRDGGGRGEGVRRRSQDDVRAAGPHELRVRPQRAVLEAAVGDADGEAAEVPHDVAQDVQQQSGGWQQNRAAASAAGPQSDGAELFGWEWTAADDDQDR